MGRELDHLDGPALAIRKILRLQSVEELQHAREALLVIDILDGGVSSRRIGRHIVLQRYGNVDQLARHGFPHECCYWSIGILGVRRVKSKATEGSGGLALDAVSQ